jgi:hypothetical protein
MTPHRHYFNEYRPDRRPIHLANGSIVYSEGIGSVIFVPILNGLNTRPIEFTGVLHVPRLSTNLLSVLFLVNQRDVDVSISKDIMSFTQESKLLFEAHINAHNTAFLVGETRTNTPKTSFAVSGAPKLNWSLWHQRFAHHSIRSLKNMVYKDLVAGMSGPNDPAERQDIICEPCPAGKMSANPFPSSSRRSKHLLELVHSDLHQLKSPTHDGYKYWITFIDD